MERSSKYYEHPLIVEPAGLGEVQRAMLGLGADDGPFLRHVISALVGLPGDLLRPAVALLIAQAIGKEADGRVIRLATAIQTVYAASLAHRQIMNGGTDAETDRLMVLAADYLYAQAAVITAGLDNLQVMAMLAESIKQLCQDAMPDTPAAVVEAATQPRASGGASCGSAATGSHGLFQLSAAGTGRLLSCDDATMACLAAYGTLLDGMVERRMPGHEEQGGAAADQLLHILPDSASRGVLAGIAATISMASVVDHRFDRRAYVADGALHGSARTDG
jgi:hypothetical protein